MTTKGGGAVCTSLSRHTLFRWVYDVGGRPPALPTLTLDTTRRGSPHFTSAQTSAIHLEGPSRSARPPPLRYDVHASAMRCPLALRGMGGLNMSGESEWARLQALLETELPGAYKAFVVPLEASAEVPDPAKGVWLLRTVSALLEPSDVDGNTQPFVQVLAAYAKTLREFMGDSTADRDGNPFGLDRLAGCVAIGRENTETLFLDPSDGFSVWCFYPDGGDVRKLSDSFDAWLQGLGYHHQ